MALAFADRVRETTTTTGTGTITLAGAVTGYQSFSAIGNGNTTYYTINAGSQWEVGIGTYTASGTTLSRDTVLSSSNAGSLVDFSAGTKDVFAGYPAGKVVIQDASGNVGIGTASPGAKLDVAGEIRIYPSSSPAQLRFGVSGVEKGKLAVDSSSNMLFETAGSERMRITSAGYVGVGVTPSASTEPLLQMQNGGMIATAGPYAHFMANAFYGSGGWTYTTTGTASRYEQAVGTHKWYVAASGTAGNPITFTQAMALDGAGNVALTKLAFNIDSPFYTGGNITAGSNALGIGTTGAAQVGFFTNNSERLRITSAGFVGIGTSSPSSKLTVLDGDIEVNATGLGNTLLSFNGTTANLTVNSSSAPLVFGTNSTERMRITSAGNVGIGTSSPGAKLHVAGGGNIRLTATSDGSNGVFQVYDSASSTLFQLYNDSTKANLAVVEAKPMVFYTTNTERMRIASNGNMTVGSTSSFARLASVAADGTYQLALVGTSKAVRMRSDTTNFKIEAVDQTLSSSYEPLWLGGSLIQFGTSTTERMRLDTSGNVGIGTTGPDSRLVVSDSAAIATLRVNTSNTGVSASNYSQIALSDVDATRTWWRNVRDGTGKTAFGYNNHLAFLSDAGGTPTERMRIDGSGNVGIGTTSPSQRLDVTVSSGTEGVGLGVTNSLAGGYGSGVTFYSIRSDTSAKVEAGAIRMIGANAWNSDGTTSSSMRFFTVNANTAAERMRITAAGNVGIGTTVPALPLVVSNAGAGGLEFNHSGAIGGGTYIQSYNRSTAAYIPNTNYALSQTWYSGATRAMDLDSSGNLGIGTSSPSAKLDVVTAGAFAAEFNGTNTYVDIIDSTVTGRLQAVGNVFYIGTTAAVKNLGFKSGAGVEAMLITSAGNVGIGTSSPTSISNYKAITLDATTGTFIDFRENGTNRLRIGGDGGTAFINGASGTLRLLTSDVERARIDSSGNLLVGTTTAQGKLSVNSATGNVGFNTGTSSSPERGNLWYDTDGTGWKFNIGKRQSGSFTAQMTFQDNGNVGIGTTSPSTILHVAGSSVTEVRVTSSGNLTTGAASLLRFGGSNSATSGYIGYGGTASTIDLWNTLAGSLTFGTSNLERMRIDASGNLLVGTTSATAGYLMSVNGALTLANGYSLSWGAYNSGGPTIAGSTNFLAFYPNGASSGEKMRIDASGNVGIGTTAPASKLHVSGSYITAGSVSSTGGSKILAGEYSNAEHITTFGSDYSSGGPVIGYGVWPSTTTSGAFISSAAVNIQRSAYLISGQTHIWYSGAAQNIAVGSAVTVTERMRIDASGNVGIGTSSPTSISGYTALKINNATNGAILDLAQADTVRGRLVATSGSFTLETTGSIPLAFAPGGTERFRITSTGGITSSDLADAVGYKGLPQNSQTTGYTLALSDMGKHISITTGNITIPANGSVAFPVGAAVTIFNNSGSTQTISITTDTLRQAGTTNTGTRTLAAYGVATVLKVASTTWVISGNVS